MSPAGLVVAMALVARSVSSGAAQPDERAQRLALTLTAEIEDFTGPVERHCGIYLLTRDAEEALVTADRQKIVNALRCVTAAKRRGRAAWAIWQASPGIDSTSFRGFATTATSDIHIVSANLGAGTDLRLTPCLKARVDKNAAVTCLNRSEPLSAGDLKSALSRLERDVARTRGSSSTDIVTRVARAAMTAAGAAPEHEGFLTKIVDEVQLEIHNQSLDNWPECPVHHNHPLEFRDGRWFCGRDAAFIVELGRLPPSDRNKRRP